MVRIAVVDYESGNVRSVLKAVEKVGGVGFLTHNSDEILLSDGVILPGVGAFGDCKNKLEKYELVETIKSVVDSGKPFLGICVGMQLLFEKSYEFGEHEGFGFVKGEVRRFEAYNGFKVPHMGWNRVCLSDNRLFYGIENNSYFYFVHSYYAKAEDDSEIATCRYSIEFTAAVNKGKMWGVQFHPEKSQQVGLKLLKNFCDICEGKL
ncbi:imidazole glycerol phosphate synthase subunit HisH [Hippea alviniae]|uniref:imidazole glycerol phosphate synthase subunit HisH n=1 Tax=Hippea alviniae TaxID=1279027 RepID=UPI0003B52F8F|nr:imidazole glycerol phosphate synthase subunit HisH [Hippea alviniae]